MVPKIASRMPDNSVTNQPQGASAMRFLSQALLLSLPVDVGHVDIRPKARGFEAAHRCLESVVGTKASA